MFGYRVPAPDEAMLVSGGKGAHGAPFRVVTGHGAFVPPVFRKARYLTLAMQESTVTEQCVSKQGITLDVRAVIAFKVGNDQESIVNAGQRFLSDQRQMPMLTGRIFAGHLRSIIGSMTVEEIVTERQKLAVEVLDGSKTEMATIGLIVDSLQIQSIDDMGSGYIAAMAAPHQAAIQRQAKIAQAAADRESSAAEQASARQQAQYARETAAARAKYQAEVDVATAQAAAARAEAEQESARNQAQYARDTAVVQASYKAETDKANAEAAQAGPLAQASVQREVVAAQADLAEAQAELRARQLSAEIIKPAEAEAERVRILAQAEAERIRINAEAVASSDRVALDQLLINQLPQIMKETAGGLAGANLTVVNGTAGLTEVATGLVTQALAVIDAIRGGMNGHAGSVVLPQDDHQQKQGKR